VPLAGGATVLAPTSLLQYFNVFIAANWCVVVCRETIRQMSSYAKSSAGPASTLLPGGLMDGTLSVRRARPGRLSSVRTMLAQTVKKLSYSRTAIIKKLLHDYLQLKNV